MIHLIICLDAAIIKYKGFVLILQKHEFSYWRLKMRSDEIKRGLERAPHRTLLKALGLTDQEIEKPFIGIANSFTTLVPGHIHLNEIANAVKTGIVAAGGFAVLRGESSVPLVGASGAVSAALGAYLVLFPWNRVKVLYWFFIVFGVIHVPAIVAIVVWFIGQFAYTYHAIRHGLQTSVAYSAHVSGFVFGFIVAAVLRAMGIVRPPKRHLWSVGR